MRTLGLCIADVMLWFAQGLAALSYRIRFAAEDDDANDRDNPPQPNVYSMNTHLR